MKSDDEALRTARVSRCNSRGIVDWILALTWPLMGVGSLLVLWRLDDIAHGSVEEKFGYVSLVLASFGMRILPVLVPSIWLLCVGSGNCVGANWGSAGCRQELRPSIVIHYILDVVPVCYYRDYSDNS